MYSLSKHMSPRAAELLKAFFVTSGIFSFVLFSTQAYASSVTLTVQVQQYLSFNASMTGTDNFGNLVPGTPVYATTTLNTVTNDAHGWSVTLSGDNKDATHYALQLVDPNPADPNHVAMPHYMTTYLDRTSDLQIHDLATFAAAGATTTSANASALTGSENVLAFRVAASSTTGTAFTASSWWGADGHKLGVTTDWAGIPSSTAAQTIGDAGYGSFSGATPHLNTVQYYLNVSAGQETGDYSAPVTYTATGTI